MRFASNLQAALTSLWEQRHRSFLSALGVMVAMVALILLIGIARGVQKDLTEQVKQLGVNVVVVLPARIDTSGIPMNPNMGGQSYLRTEHSDLLRQQQGVVRTAVLTFAGGGIKYGEKEAYPILIAAGPEWFEMHPVQLQTGALCSPSNDQEPVCVIGSVAADALFGEGKDALGKQVQMNGQTYKVIGVTQDEKEESSLFSMGSFQNVVYIPWRGFKAKNPNAQIDRIMVQTAPEAEPKELVKRLDSVLRANLDEQQFSVLTQEDLLGLVYRLMSILTWLLTGLTSIALFVGGVGIMAIMLMSVGERVKEIGVRKTVGARRQDVFQQFVIEAIVVSVFGGLLGLAFSGTVSWFLARYTVIKPEISPALVAFSLGVCLVVGTVFGLLPAMNASRKDPVAALRSE